MSTPIRRQYLEIKRRFPHAIVFFRLGDFYETFDEDAKLVAQGARDHADLEADGQGPARAPGRRAVPLAAGPPASKLVARGFKVAICEQMEDPKQAKGIVEREVVRVVTPGTVVEEELLSAAANNYLVGRRARRGSDARRADARPRLRRRHDGRVLRRRGLGRRPRRRAGAPGARPRCCCRRASTCRRLRRRR